MTIWLYRNNSANRRAELVLVLFLIHVPSYKNTGNMPKQFSSFKYEVQKSKQMRKFPKSLLASALNVIAENVLKERLRTK